MYQSAPSVLSFRLTSVGFFASYGVNILQEYTLFLPEKLLPGGALKLH